MENFWSNLTAFNDKVNGVVWGQFGLILLIGTGILMTCLTKVFQVTHFAHWWKTTIGSVFGQGKARKKTDKKSISQFQALCTALAATIGTGNIAGVSAAIVFGGPGAVFWMWIAAFFGMMTNYSENVLGIYYRRRNLHGEWSGGAMYYLADGLGGYKGFKGVGKFLAVLFSTFAAVAAFGIGNMGQINKITLNMKSAFFPNNTAMVGDIPLMSIILGLMLMVLVAVVVVGGLQRVAAVAERLVPFMAVLYVIGALIVCFVHIDKLGEMFGAIFRFAFGIKAVAGGAVGVTIKEVITRGCKRGVFSNEAGLGSSVMVHSSSNVSEPVLQGMWGIFEVFFDTIIVCTMTAIVVLASGFIDLETGLPIGEVDDATLVAKSFGNVFGRGGEMFVALAVLLFAFTTVLGWSQYGGKAVEYLFGTKAVKVYSVLFTIMVIPGAIMQSSLAWDISDTFNGLMMFPNLIGVLSLSGLVMKITKNYIDRNLRKKDVEPLLSHFPDIQKEQKAKLEAEKAAN